MAARLSQDAAQLAAEPTSAAVRLSQAAAQAAAIPTSAAIRLSQYVLIVALVEPTIQPFEEHGLMLTADRWN